MAFVEQEFAGSEGGERVRGGRRSARVRRLRELPRSLVRARVMWGW